MSRLIWLIRLIYVLSIGYVAGDLIVTFVLAIVLIVEPLPHWLTHGPVAPIGGLIGALWAVVTRRVPERREEPSTHGSARFARLQEIRASLGGRDGLIVGRSADGGRAARLLRYAGSSHLLTIAPTRSGKGVGAIIPNLLSLERSILCIDPKGENARICRRARAAMGPVHVLDPFGVSGAPSSAFNPLAQLDPQSLDLAEDTALIADALVYDPPHQTSEAHWNEEAKALISGVILHVITAMAPHQRSLATVRDLITRSPDQFLILLEDMQASSAAAGLVARAANRHLSKSEREAAGVLSAAQRHTHFLDSPRMTKVLGHSDFQFEDLKRGVTTVFLVLPPDRLATHARWLRLLVVQAIGALARSPADRSVLMLLDEFAALGHLEPVERAFGLMAGYGVQLWAILQDLHQLKSAYGQHAGTFLSNAGLIQIFNVADVDTATWVSRSLGSLTQTFVTTGTSSSQHPMKLLSTKTTSTSVNLTRRELMTPDEVMRLSQDHLILLRPGSAPALARKVRFYADAEFQGTFDL